MLLSTEQLAELIHDSPVRVVLAAAGGGSRAIADLLEVPGASRTLIEAVVPYSAAALAEWLGGEPDEACSAATARAMAMAAFLRARRLAPAEETAGAACTAGLATDRPRLGPHRIHVAMQTAGCTAAWHLQLLKGRRSREEEERLAGRLLMNAAAEACGVARRLVLDLLEGERVETSRAEAPRPWQDLLLGRIEPICAKPGATPEGETPRAVFPGAFHPLHDGHRRMMQIAKEIVGQPPAAELSILNVDKPPLDYIEIEHRLEQFPAETAVYLTRAAGFEAKSRLFPGATFIVGADTLRRIAEPRYYGGDAAACRRAIEQIAARGCGFLVFGRDSGEGFVGLPDLELPETLRALCREVPSEDFREDISSTAQRRLRVERNSFRSF